jgi:histidine triad (HIT) family protein
MSNECLFCRIVSGDVPAGIVYEDDEVVAFRDIRPEAPTHLLLVPRKHVATLAEAPDAPVLGRLLLRAGELAVQENVAATGFRLVVNSGEWAGQTVSHLHVHLLGGRRLTWPPG